MEYYTKSEGLGFLIGESRIDFRIEFRGVSILCEFNSSTRYGFRRTIIRRLSTYLGLSRPWSLMATKRCYGRNRTHQRPLVSHDQRGLSWPPPEYVMVTLEPINVSWSLTTSMVSHDHRQTVRHGLDKRSTIARQSLDKRSTNARQWLDNARQCSTNARQCSTMLDNGSTMARQCSTKARTLQRQ